MAQNYHLAPLPTIHYLGSTNTHQSPEDIVAALVVGAEGEGGGFRLPLLLSGWSLRPWAILGVADSSEGFSCDLTWTASPRVDRTGPFRKWQ